MFEQNAKITVRNLDPKVLQALAELAESHDRSLEAEARQALRAWVDPQLRREGRASRIVEVAQRLAYLRHELDELPSGRSSKPSRLAQAIGLSHAQLAEEWFSGRAEPSFDELYRLAEVMGCSPEWLLHGDQMPFPSQYCRIPEHIVAGPDFLLQPSTQGAIPQLHLIRSLGSAGEFAFVRQYDDWVCEAFRTPYHVSDEIGAGGEASLAWLSLVLEALYLRWTRSKNSHEIQVRGYLLPQDTFETLLSGKQHPLKVIDSVQSSTWWEDFGDVKQIGKMPNYWPQCAALAARIARVVEGNIPMRQAREELAAFRG